MDADCFETPAPDDAEYEAAVQAAKNAAIGHVRLKRLGRNTDRSEMTP